MMSHDKPPRPPRVTASKQYEVPILAQRSPELPVSMSSAQRYLEKRQEKKLFDSADYFSASKMERDAKSVVAARGSAFEHMHHEFQRLGQTTRPSALSFENLADVSVDDYDYLSEEDDDVNEQDRSKRHPMRRGSMEDFLVDENEHEVVKHAILPKPKLKRWDSGDFFSSPREYRKMLATQAKEALLDALEQAQDSHQSHRRRRSSLSLSEYNSGNDDMEE